MTQTTDGRIERAARLRWIPVEQMRISPASQREQRDARVDHIASNFDPERLGVLTVNERDGFFYVIDGGHRMLAMRAVGWGDQSIQCATYVGLTEEEEAETFLKLNDVLAVDAMSKFRIGVTAGRLEECDIDRIVRACDLRVSTSKVDGSISAVGALRKAYHRKCLARTLRVVRDSYGNPGYQASVIDGLSLVFQRYGEEIKDERAVEKLSGLQGGVNGLLGRAEHIRRQMGAPKNHSIAAATVEVLNAGRGGKKLSAWWRDEDDDATASVTTMRAASSAGWPAAKRKP